MDDSDAISLITFPRNGDRYETPSRPPSPGPSRSFQQPSSSAYDRLKSRLHVIGDYAATSEGWLSKDFDTGRIQCTWHNLYRGEDPSLTWTPLLSKSKGHLIIYVFCLSVACHQLLALTAQKVSWWTTYVPVCCALLLAVVFNEFTAGEIRRRNWVPKPKNGAEIMIFTYSRH